MATSKPFVSPSFTYETLEEKLDVKPQGTELLLGIPKESSFSENRIALTPEAVGVMVANGHRVIVETKAGEGSSYSDTDYSEAGAEIAYSHEAVFAADIILKIAPPSPEEITLLKRKQTLISALNITVQDDTYLKTLMEKKVNCIVLDD